MLVILSLASSFESSKSKADALFWHQHISITTLQNDDDDATGCSFSRQ
jgi:hypothetical protein